MSRNDRKAADDLVQEVIGKVRDGYLNREEGQEEIKATLQRFRYASDIIDYALKMYFIKL